MINAPLSPRGKWWDFFAQLLVSNNQSEKVAAEQCNVNAWLGKMVPFLSLKNICIVNQFLPY